MDTPLTNFMRDFATIAGQVPMTPSVQTGLLTSSQHTLLPGKVNSIGKLKTFLSEFRNDNSFIKNVEKLKLLKIGKLP